MTIPKRENLGRNYYEKKRLPDYKKKLSLKQSKFVMAYVKYRNAAKAAQEAGYTPPEGGTVHDTNVRFAVIGAKLLQNPLVVAEIRNQLDNQAARTLVTPDRIIKEVAGIAFFDPGECFDDDGNLLNVKDMPEVARRALASFEVEEKKEWNRETRQKEVVGVVKKVKFVDKDRALEKLMKNYGMISNGTLFFQQNNQHNNSLTVQQNNLTNALIQNTLKIDQLTQEELDTLVKLIDTNTTKIDNDELIVDTMLIEHNIQKTTERAHKELEHYSGIIEQTPEGEEPVTEYTPMKRVRGPK